MRKVLIAVALLALIAPVASALAVHADVKVQRPDAPALPPVPAVPSASTQAPGLPSAPQVGLPVQVDASVDDHPILPASVPEPDAPASSFAASVAPLAKKAAPPALATVGAFALLQAFGAFRFLGMGAFALYSRLTKSNLLDNEHRDGVYKLIQENPGLGVSEIASRSGLGWGTTVYHLDRLEREGFVASERGGLHKCYFAVGLVDRATRRAAATLKADTRRDVAQVLVSRPGITQSELCEALGLSASAASKQVSKLEQAG